MASHEIKGEATTGVDAYPPQSTISLVDNRPWPTNNRPEVNGRPLANRRKTSPDLNVQLLPNRRAAALLIFCRLLSKVRSTLRWFKLGPWGHRKRHDSRVLSSFSVCPCRKRDFCRSFAHATLLGSLCAVTPWQRIFRRPFSTDCEYVFDGKTILTYWMLFLNLCFHCI